MRAMRYVSMLLLLAVALVLPGGSAVADPPVFNDRVLSGVGVFNSCNGEFVSVSGTAHILTKSNNDGSFSQRFDFHGKGTGSLGNEYVIHLLSVFNSAGVEFSFDERVTAVSKGSAPNVRLLFHFDSATGTFTFTTDCTG